MRWRPKGQESRGVCSIDQLANPEAEICAVARAHRSRWTTCGKESPRSKGGKGQYRESCTMGKKTEGLFETRHERSLITDSLAKGEIVRPGNTELLGKTEQLILSKEGIHKGVKAAAPKGGGR